MIKIGKITVDQIITAGVEQTITIETPKCGPNNNFTAITIDYFLTLITVYRQFPKLLFLLLHLIWLFIIIFLDRNCLQWGRPNLVDPVEWPKFCLLNRDFGNISSIFPRKHSKTQSSLKFVQSGPRKLTKSDLSGLALIRRVLTRFPCF